MKKKLDIYYYNYYNVIKRIRNESKNYISRKSDPGRRAIRHPRPSARLVELFDIIGKQDIRAAERRAAASKALEPAD